ncbi:hypothetical protein KR084_007264 [Drosophila pseudotakahashii]|nr:hypothetical protein KR084_007264 [Drosophila pseudotakahashii]
MRLLIFLLLPLVAISRGDDYCYSKDTAHVQNRQFSSMTAYQNAKSSDIDKQHELPGCTAKKIWIMHRHGTRLPEKKFIKGANRLNVLRDLVIKNYEETNKKIEAGSLCQTDYDAIKAWKWNSSITEDKNEYLTSQGYEDLKGTATLYKRLFPSVLPSTYNDTYYYFRHTGRQRTDASFRAFAEGLFGTNNSAHPAETPKTDMLLRPFDKCQNYEDFPYNIEGTEFYKFQHSKLYNETLAKISTRLGFASPLNEKDIKMIYDMCRFEQAWNLERNSAWCGAFLPEDVTVFEYLDDLKYYYGWGYGFPAAGKEKLNCRLVQDLLKHLDSKVSPHVVAYFGHSTGLLYLLNALGFQKDGTKLTADNHERMTNRLWKSSRMDPFGSNLMAVKYDCPKESDGDKVVFFLNQQAVQLDWCKEGVCKWSDVLEKYKTFLEVNCDDYYCQKNAPSVGSGLRGLLATSLVNFMH